MKYYIYILFVFSIILSQSYSEFTHNYSELTHNYRFQDNYLIKVSSIFSKGRKLDTAINKVDSHGRKQGYWREEKYNSVIECYYINDLKVGIFKLYSVSTGTLTALGCYNRDKPVGVWYHFDENGQLYMLEKVMGENKSIKVKNDKENLIFLPFKSYVELYYNNGVIQKEGVALFDEDIEIGFYKYGTWKYYNKSGKLIKKENYKYGKIN